MANNFPRLRIVFAVVALIITSSFSARAQDSMQRWENYDFAQTSLKSSEISKLPLEDLKLIRGIIFGRHGRAFKDAEIKVYLFERSWFHADPNFQNSMLNDVERRNLDLIRDAEAGKHENVQPGDMRYWRNRLLTKKQLGQHSSAEWLVLRSEIEAVHGKRFEDEPWLQQYFFGQPWYTPDEKFKDEDLSGANKQNVETIVAYENLLHQDLSAKPISRSLLEGLFVEDASKMRQEIYARRGKVFKEPWFKTYFASFDWYRPNPEFTDAQLTAVEKRNIATIAAYEKKAVSAMSVIEG